MPQRDEQFLRTASLDEIRAAHAAGELDDVLTDIPEGQIGHNALRSMKPDEIAKAFGEGKLAHVLGGQPD